MSRFYLNDDETNSSSSSFTDELSTLPYPAPLPRSDFLAPNFDPSTYLSSLGHRHQTLEDLRLDLRSRSQLLTKELLDLINAHYADFLNLGTSLKGGEEKVEELRLGLLGFQREVEDIRKVVAARESDVKGLLEERKAVRKEIALGRRLIDWEGRVSRLEGKLMVDVNHKKDVNEDLSDSDEDEDMEEEDAEEDDTIGGVPLTKLRQRVHEFVSLRKMEECIGSDHPFVIAQRGRIMRIRNTVLLDLGTALRQARLEKADAKSMNVMALYRDMDAAKEATEVLKGLIK